MGGRQGKEGRKGGGTGRGAWAGRVWAGRAEGWVRLDWVSRGLPTLRSVTRQASSGSRVAVVCV